LAFNQRDYDIEEWLRLEGANLLQKVCNVVDDDGFLVEQYKTRVYIVPVGKPIPYKSGQLSVSAPCLYRSFNYDDEGNQIASLPEMREWLQACEDAAQGANPDDPTFSGVPAGLKVAKSTYLEFEANSVPVGATVVLASITIPAEEAIYLRHVVFSGENRGKFQVFVNGSKLQTKRTWWTRWDGDMWFNTANGGILYESEETIEVKVTNLGVEPADFEASIGYVIK